MIFVRIFFYKHKTSYEMRISYWSSGVCSSDLLNLKSGVVAIVREPPPFTNVKPRSLVALAPVYCSVPPSTMRLDDAADDAPRPLATPPSPMLLTRNVPFVRFVPPVWLLAPVSTTVPVPPLKKLVAPPLSTMVGSREEVHAAFCCKPRGPTPAPPVGKTPSH